MVIFILLVIIASSAFIGWQIKNYYISRSKFFSDVVMFCDIVLNETNFSKTPLRQIVKKNEKSFHKDFLKALDAFLISLDEGKPYKDNTQILGTAEKELFENFLNSLGKTDLINHNNIIGAYKQTISQKIEKEMESEKKKGSAFFKISICVGACIAILCI